ncbi:YqeG family HAD IIIA-type phosphatase [Pediococcus argentinicus]|uniref:HAD superfamily (Subfamily IIIA) phosphatase n=1 Tax=Pediococcus argentinicus TaxID=480391 RepID=A0A0R2NLU8_9LACO|nr:YqeG family HAD IIIA-type phosphatase [Pediococcus argentinicus]KRO25360.1 HAD superfamily (subfamily IIIA) phosphatase [Pediococcus argentinicus]NKZ22278.1 YqeG family HAD IIIA-type phosphatase [Pediococcus argentinicus]GEP19357.1 haloacid dehalogenase [Pediococcus argentinicus]
MHIFKPHWMVERIYNLSTDNLKSLGIKAVLTDLDNTLIAWDNPDGTPELHQWIEELKQAQIEVIVVSNNSNERVAKAVEGFGLKYQARALKPLTVGIMRALRNNHLTKQEVIMVGDQYITDMVASNLSGVRGVLVKPLVTTDAWNTKINRWFEKFIKRSLRKKYPDMEWKRELDK